MPLRPRRAFAIPLSLLPGSLCGMSYARIGGSRRLSPRTADTLCE